MADPERALAVLMEEGVRSQEQAYHRGAQREGQCGCDLATRKRAKLPPGAGQDREYRGQQCCAERGRCEPAERLHPRARQRRSRCGVERWWFRGHAGDETVEALAHRSRLAIPVFELAHRRQPDRADRSKGAACVARDFHAQQRIVRGADPDDDAARIAMLCGDHHA